MWPFHSSHGQRMSNHFEQAALAQAAEPILVFQTVLGEEALRACQALLAGPGAERLQNFSARVHALRADGHVLVAAHEAGAVVAVAGYRYQRNLVLGDFLHIDHLAALPAARGPQWPARLLGGLMDCARKAGCGRLVLDPAFSKSLQHRFYSSEEMASGAIRFAQVLETS